MQLQKTFGARHPILLGSSFIGDCLGNIITTVTANPVTSCLFIGTTIVGIMYYVLKRQGAAREITDLMDEHASHLIRTLNHNRR